MGNEKITLPGVLGFVFILLILNYAGFFDQVSKSANDFKDIVKDTTPVIVDTVEETVLGILDSIEESIPPLIDAGITYCSVPDLVLEAIQPFMLENVNDETRDVLLKIKDGQNITACEIKILDENLTPIYKSNLNFKSINPKVLGCNLLDCAEKYNLIPNP